MTALADTAARELRARERDPDWDAADTAAWRAIAVLLRDGEVETGLGWPQLVAAAEAAEDRRLAAWIEARAAASPNLAAIEQRLLDVATIRRTLQRNAWSRGHCLPRAGTRGLPERIAA